MLLLRIFDRAAARAMAKFPPAGAGNDTGAGEVEVGAVRTNDLLTGGCMCVVGCCSCWPVLLVVDTADDAASAPVPAGAAK